MPPIEYYTAAEIAPIIGVNQTVWRNTARDNPNSQPFPILLCGNTVKIPKIPFDEFAARCGYKPGD